MGIGSDKIDYSSMGGDIDINLTAGTASGSTIGTDSFSGIEKIKGGTGGEVIIAANLSFEEFDGHSGNDEFQLTGSGQSFDLTSGSSTNLMNIDIINIDGSGNNTLIINETIVQSSSGGNSSTNNFTGTNNTIVVAGSGGDSVDLNSGWSTSANRTIDGEGYSIYTNTNNDAILYIDSNISVI